MTITTFKQFVETLQQLDQYSKNDLLKHLQNKAKELNSVIIITGDYPIFNDGDVCQYGVEIEVYKEYTGNMERVLKYISNVEGRDLADYIDTSLYESRFYLDTETDKLYTCVLFDLDEAIIHSKPSYSSEVFIPIDSKRVKEYKDIYELANYKDICQFLTGYNGILKITPNSIHLKEIDWY